MKKRVLLALIAILCVASCTACGNSGSSGSRKNFGSGGISGIVDDASQNVTNGEDITASSQDTTDTDNVISSNIGKIENLPAYLCGTYVGSYNNAYSTEWFILDESSFTYHTPDKDYVFSVNEFDIEVDQSNTTIYITKDSVSYIYFYYSRSDSGFYINGTIQKLDDNTLDNSIDLYAHQTDVLNYEALDTFVNVDNEGKWGSIPYLETLESMLLDGMSEDYYIYYYPSTLYTTDDAGNAIEYLVDNYRAGCFSEEGYSYNRSNYAYVFKNESDAQAAYDYYISDDYNVEYYVYSISGCIVSYYYKSYAQPDVEVYSEYNTTKIKFAYNSYFVCDVHCSSYYDTIYYFAKPIRRADIENQLTLSASLSVMKTNGTIYSDDGNYSLYIYGDGFWPDIEVSLYNESLYLYCYDACVVDGKVVANYKYDYEDISYYCEVTKQDSTLTVVVRKYNGIDTVSYDTYASVTPESEYSFQATIPESTY